VALGDMEGTIRQGRAQIEIKFLNQGGSVVKSIDGLIDTGCSVDLLLESSLLADVVGAFRPSLGAGRFYIRGMGGLVRATSYTSQVIWFDDKPTRVLVAVPDKPGMPVTGNPPAPCMLLGGNLLFKNRVLFDYPNNKVFIQKP